jgi:hypothetical protein
MTEDLEKLIEEFRDGSASVSIRIAAAAALANRHEITAREALVEAATHLLPDEIAAAAGRALAIIAIRENSTASMPLYDFSGTAYLAFDRAVADNEKNQA